MPTTRGDRRPGGCDSVPKPGTLFRNRDMAATYTRIVKEAEAAGCTVKWSDTIVPSISEHVLAEDKGGLARMNIPDPKSAGRLPMFLELCEGLMAAKLPAAAGRWSSTLAGTA